MADYGDFKRGGVAFPLTASTANSLLRDADPALFYALDYFAAMIRHHVGDRLMAAVALTDAPIASPVAMLSPIDPVPYLTEAQFKFPLLAVYRLETEFTMHTVTWRKDECRFGAAYILPPLTAGQAVILLPILNAIKAVIDDRTQMGHDPAYTPPGGNPDDVVWSAPFAGVQAINIKKATFGAYAGIKGDNIFPALVFEGSFTEREGNATFVQLQGVDAHQDLVVDGTTITDFNQFASDVTPDPPTG